MARHVIRNPGATGRSIKRVLAGLRATDIRTAGAGRTESPFSRADAFRLALLTFFFFCDLAILRSHAELRRGAS